jgi:hypothetical protein
MRMVSMVGQTKVCPCHELWADRLNRTLTKFFWHLFKSEHVRLIQRRARKQAADLSVCRLFTRAALFLQSAGGFVHLTAEAAMEFSITLRRNGESNAGCRNFSNTCAPILRPITRPSLLELRK